MVNNLPPGRFPSSRFGSPAEAVRIDSVLAIAEDRVAGAARKVLRVHTAISFMGITATAETATSADRTADRGPTAAVPA